MTVRVHLFACIALNVYDRVSKFVCAYNPEYLG